MYDPHLEAMLVHEYGSLASIVWLKLIKDDGPLCYVVIPMGFTNFEMSKYMYTCI